MLLTASVTDASFNHLGSTLTEGFLDSRKEIKNQFLVYCMKGTVSHMSRIMRNNNKKFRSCKSKENIHKKEVGSYRGFSY